MKYSEDIALQIRNHQIITKVTDGDSIEVEDFFTREKEKVRLYGIDAPEIISCPKLKQDETKAHLPGELLIKLGRLSLKQFLLIAPPKTKITIHTEAQNPRDRYGRLLGYLYLESGECINEILLKEGYVKAYNDIYCDQLPKYQELNFDAKRNKKGLYKFVNHF